MLVGSHCDGACHVRSIFDDVGTRRMPLHRSCFFAGGRCTSSDKMNIGERQFVSVPGMTSDSLLPMLNWRVRAAIAEVEAGHGVCPVILFSSGCEARGRR